MTQNANWLQFFTQSWRLQTFKEEKKKSVFNLKNAWFGFFNTDCPTWLTAVTAKEGR